MRLEDRLLIKNLANTAKLVNTINGGMVEPLTVLEETETAWLLRMRVPGVSIDNIKIEVKEDFLFVFQNLKDEDAEIELPYMIGTLNLTNKINLDLIRAEYNHGEILVYLPFDELANGYEKEIEIVRR